MTLTLDRTPTSDLRADAWEDAIATTLDAPRAYDDTPRARVEQHPVIGGAALGDQKADARVAIPLLWVSPLLDCSPRRQH